MSSKFRRFPSWAAVWVVATTSATAVSAVTAVAAGTSQAPGADPIAAGGLLFKQRCAICHSAQPGDGGGGQGPSLAGVFGRHAGSVPGFAYTDALRNSKLLWDGPTLERFLAAPSTTVPGTAMVLAVTASDERDQLIGYLQSLGGMKSFEATGPVAVPGISRRTADWQRDAPGRMHHIRLADLPPPYATPSVANGHRQVPRPANAVLAVPKGFHVDTFATGLKGPRRLLVAANGDIFVSETRGGRISVLHPLPNGAGVGQQDVYLDGLKQPFGMAFYPNAAQPKWLYVAETDRVTRYAFAPGDINPHGAAEVVVPELPHGGGHITRDIAFSADGRRLYVSVGSGSNVAESMSKKTPTEIAAWDSAHGVGAAWDEETGRADVLVFDVSPNAAVASVASVASTAAAAPVASTAAVASATASTTATATAKPYATGVRNCVSLTLQPATGALWCTTNERDGLGDDLVPDYSTRLRENGFYGWPWYYLGAHEDPRHAGERPDLKSRTLVPDVLYQAHSAALSLTFYAASTGKSAFPAEYTGDGFVAFHGSWNRSLRTGYKLVRLRMKNGVPTGEYSDFLTGFIVDDGDVWGRPVATAELADGSLLLSDDGVNTIYRISYSR